MKISRRFLLPLSVMLVAVVVLAACGSSSSSTKASTNGNSSSTSASSTAAGSLVLKTATIPNVGKVLVDANGKTVYTLTNNGAMVACTGSCLTAWPPVLLPSGDTTASGAKDLGVVEDTMGKQVTSSGLPLYTFSGDATAGTANGEGLASFGGTWHVVKLSVTSTGSSSTTTTTSGGGYNY
ncbi:MAG: COG4315 family predicted lipoprotein [Acidimicrobiia bacterium]